MARVSKNGNKQKEGQSKRTAILYEVANEWLAFKSLSVKASTYARYKAALDIHVLPFLGDCETKEITSTHISTFANEKLENGRLDKTGGLAASTVCGLLTIIKSILDFALKTGKIKSPIRIPYPKHRCRKVRVLSKEEQIQLESCWTKGANIHKLGMLLCLYTGIRIGELCALHWQDISIEQGMITICRTLQRVKDFSGSKNKTMIKVGTPKSQSSIRNIPIPKFLLSIIQEHSTDKHGYFLASKKHGYTEPRTMQNYFARITKQLNISEANFHALRHTFATRCIEAGVDIKSLSEMLGHSCVNITLNRYVHSSFEQKRVGIDKLEKFVRA